MKGYCEIRNLAGPDANKKTYQEASGLRFEVGYPKDEMEERLERPYVEDRDVGNDSACFLEHFAVDSTAALVRNPLKPYALISGVMDLEEVREKRKKRAWGLISSLGIDQGNLFRKEGMYFNVSPSDLKELKILIKQESGGKLPTSLQFVFKKMKLGESGDLYLPSLDHIFNVDEYPSRLIVPPSDLAQRVKATQFSRARYDPKNPYGPTKCALFIDQEGFRYDKGLERQSYENTPNW